MPDLDMRMIATDLAETFAERHEIDVCETDILPHLAAFLEAIAPGIVSDREGSPRRPAASTDRQRAADRVSEFLVQHDQIHSEDKSADRITAIAHTKHVVLNASDLRLLVQAAPPLPPKWSAPLAVDDADIAAVDPADAALRLMEATSGIGELPRRLDIRVVLEHLPASLKNQIARAQVRKMTERNAVAIRITDPKLMASLGHLQELGAGSVQPLTPEEEQVITCDETPECPSSLHVTRCPKAAR